VSSETQFDLSVVGELNLDLVLYGLPEELEFDREHLATDLRLTLGSSSAIFAHNFALLGNRIGFSSAIGSDPLGDLCLARLAESGADLSRVRHFAAIQAGHSDGEATAPRLAHESVEDDRVSQRQVSLRRLGGGCGGLWFRALW